MELYAAVIEWDDESIEPTLIVARTWGEMAQQVRAEITTMYQEARAESPIVLEMRTLITNTKDQGWDDFRAELGDVNGPVITTYLKEI